MNSEDILNWIILNPEFAGFGHVCYWFSRIFYYFRNNLGRSIILLLFAIGLSEADIGLIYICLGAGLGSWIGDLCSFYTGLFLVQKSRAPSLCLKEKMSF